MKRKFWTVLALVLVLPGLMMLASCTQPKVDAGPEDTEAGKPVERDTSYKPDQSESDRLKQQKEDEDRARRKDEEDRIAKENEERKFRVAKEKFVNEHIYFDYDKSTLSVESQGILKDKAGFLKMNSGAKVAIEGHCDERGTEEYNLALGQSRAESAKRYLMKLGISASRMSTKSYGEEDPDVQGSNESAWAKNRRAEFKLK